MAQRYKELLPEEKTAYELKAKQLNSNKNKGGAPSKTANKIKTPFSLFAESKAPGSNHGKLREEYTNMPVDQKYEWIMAAVRLAGANIPKILNKEEQRIYKGQISISPTAYTLFVKDMYDKIKIKAEKKSDIFGQIAQLWKQLDAKKKKKYVDRAAEVSRF